MSREILFRGKRVDNGSWETGSLVISRMGTSEAKTYIADKMTAYHTPVIPETVGQYTGLKDKNGKKIFEGDVVKGASEYFCNSSLNQKAVVLYDRGQFVFAFGETLTDCKQLEDFEVVAGWNGDVEVIGNIYDNRGLLKE